jgi:hypothetical protein
MTFDRLQVLHTVVAGTPCGGVTPEIRERLQIVAADVQELRDAVLQSGPNSRYHHETLRRHRAEAPRVWAALEKLLPLDVARSGSYYELTSQGRAALDPTEGA